MDKGAAGALRPRAAGPAWTQWTAAGVATLIFAVAAFAIARQLRGVNWPAIEAAVAAVPPDAVVLAVLAVIAALGVSSTFDSLALAAWGRPVPWRRTRATSALAVVLANGGAAGLALASAVRFRAYQEHELSGGDAAVISGVVAVIEVIGGFFLVGIGAAGSLGQASAAAHLPAFVGAALAILGLKALATFILAPRIGLMRILPSWRVRVGVVAASTAEWAAAALVLYVLLPAETRGGLLHFLPVFGLAGLLGAVSGLPAGLGAFDAIVLAVMAPRVGPAEAAAALLLYRLVYVVAPLMLAAAVMGLRSSPLAGRFGRRSIGALQQGWAEVAPTVFGLLTFAAGVVMLISVATPDGRARLRLLAGFAPPGLVDLSHLLTSLAAVCLLFLAFGVHGRRRRAYQATLGVLVGAAVTTLLKGLNYEEAVFLLALAGLMVTARGAFYRDAAPGTPVLTPGAVAAIAVALVSAGWLGLFAYQHVPYRNEMWWTFVANQGAPRFLRGSVAAAGLALVLTAWRLTRRAPASAPAPSSADLDRAGETLAGAERASPGANLVFLGDKSLMFSASGRSFVQYGVRGGMWIAMGEPVGPLGERHEMIWAFRDACDRLGVRPVFYAVGREAVADFVDCGMVASKIGEDARVELAGFGLDGPRRAPLRHAHTRGQRDGAVFEVLPPGGFDSLAGELQAVSNTWMARHQGEEKGFSLGRFDPAYLRRFPIAVVRREGRVVAFANLWPTPDRRVLAVDLMRYDPDGLKNAMDVLFIHLMLWARQEGYAEFDLGMAPLAGLQGRRLAPMVSRIGALVYREAGGLYGFEGLRAFKAKFEPRWDPVYIAAPAGWMLAPALADAALLSSGGLLGLLK